MGGPANKHNSFNSLQYKLRRKTVKNDSSRNQVELKNISDSINNLKRLETGQDFAQKTQKNLEIKLITKGEDIA